MINLVHFLTLKGSVFLAIELLQSLQMNTYFLSTYNLNMSENQIAKGYSCL